MKNLKDILEASVLDIEGMLSEDIDFNLLLNAKTLRDFNAYANMLKNFIEHHAKGPVINERQLKKGKSYVFIWDEYEMEGKESLVVGIVDKYPIVDDDYNDDAYYVIVWDDYTNDPMARFDNTGNRFGDLIQYDFGGNSMKGAYEVPSQLVSSMKAAIKDAIPF